MTTLQIISDIILKNELYILPLYSIREGGVCSCGKEDCSAPGKHPLFRYNWKVIASNKPEKVLSWLESYTKMNFGLATGRLSKITNKYLVVIDVDSQEHPILNTLPNTFSYRTGSGGHHFWFWSKYPIKNSVSLLASKVDVRGTDGYVVIPPSKHKKGNYNGINNTSIADLPQWVISILLAKPQTKVITKEKKTVQGTAPSPVYNVWIKESVPVVRDMMKTTLIPEGIRNVVMHRLLSSDRAKGCLKSELEVNARNYLKRFEKPQTFSNDVPGIIVSVMTYPAYNNSYEKINEQYVSWLIKNYKTRKPPKDLLATLTILDNEFFGLLAASPRSSSGCSLDEILAARKAYMSSKGHIEFISNYKPQLLAKKLISCGFKRMRTAKRNVWNVFLPQKID